MHTSALPSLFKEVLEEPLNRLVEEAQAQGRRAIGYTCSYIPEPLLYVEGLMPVRMRALVLFVAYGFDKELTSESEEEREKWSGYAEVLTPIVKAYCADVGIRVAETAIQVHGGYGNCSEYPIEQILRDKKIASSLEGWG